MAATEQAEKAVEETQEKKQAAMPPPNLRDSRDIRRDDEKQSPREAVKAAGNDEKLTDEEQADALDWFLSSDPDDWGAETDTIEVNVGTRQHQKWIKWTIRPVDDDVLRDIQKRGRRRTGRRAMEDDLTEELTQNSRVIVKGTVYPDLDEIAREKQVADPALVVRQRFASKPGLIAQIAGEIMALSGFDADDVREAAASAASN